MRKPCQIKHDYHQTLKEFIICIKLIYFRADMAGSHWGLIKFLFICVHQITLILRVKTHWGWRLFSVQSNLSVTIIITNNVSNWVVASFVCLLIWRGVRSQPRAINHWHICTMLRAAKLHSWKFKCARHI